MANQPPWQPLPPNVPKPPHHYRGWMLIALVLTYFVSLVFLCTEMAAMSSVPTTAETSSSSSGILATLTTLLIIVLYCFICVLDGRNVLSLFGRIHWKRLTHWKRIGLVFVYLCVFVIPALYLYFATQYFLQVRRQTIGGALSSMWLSYRAKSPPARIGIALVTSILLLSFVGLTSVFAVIDRQNAQTVATISQTSASAQVLPTDTPTQAAPLVNPTVTPTKQLQPTATPPSALTTTPTPKSTAIPILQPTLAPTHAPLPTQPPVHPTPTKPACQAINNNPWCYNFVPGNYITIPPSGFCNYFNCIPTFYGSDDPGDGYIVQCSDGTYSQSGGERGACSYHGGVSRPLYSH